jgi:hypothetical protein
MSMIMTRCPETGSEISTGIECEDDDFRSLPFVITHTTCPSCGREHNWSKADAWLNDGTSDSKGSQMDGSSVTRVVEGYRDCAGSRALGGSSLFRQLLSALASGQSKKSGAVR